MSGPYPDRREWLAYSAAGALAANSHTHAAVPRKKYPFKKSINQWALPYPEKMNLEQCLRLAKAAGFDGIELNYDL
ncbi:MAG TPA: sugar phosphate isomerase/epimerase, partial [Urbifossiella sp.]